MRSYIATALCFFFAISGVFAEQNRYYQDQIIIKFDENSSSYSEWLMNDRNGTIELLNSILGEHSSSPFISNNTLKLALSRVEQNLSFGSSHNAISKLSSIAIVKYQKNIDPLILAGKLSQINDIIYAEPLYIRETQDFPNDSLYSEQYFLHNINAIQAWELVDTSNKVMVAIVDTGVDIEHEDLIDNIAVNNGEIGLDENGNDKRYNEIDDDNNGFVDDWQGWDFAGDDGPNNNPMPGNSHGTHVAGTVAAKINNEIGVAGVANNALILGVKVSGDSFFDRSITHGYDGILYSAAVGADVINNSWGGGGFSLSEQLTIDAAVSLGSVVVGAAGNNGRNMAFYPSAYNGVFSVAATNQEDRAAFFTNYDFSVDISAPGFEIISTFPYNEYGLNSGTSMAAPVVSAIVAMTKGKYPNYTPLQLTEHIKQSADNIDTLNATRYRDKLGNGRINAFRALTDTNLKSLIVTDYLISETTNDGVLEPNEKIFVELEIQNILSPLKSLTIFPRVLSTDQPIPQNFNIKIGSLGTLEELVIPDKFEYVLPDNVPYNYLTDIVIDFYEENELLTSFGTSIFMNQSYRTIRNNKIETTITSQGNIGYNDFPANAQGDGFKYNGSQNLLFEGALIIATAEDELSNVARSEVQSVKDDAFMISQPIRVEYQNNGDLLVTNTYFTDRGDSAAANFNVINTVYQSKSIGADNIIFAVYDIINNSGAYRDSVFTGLYFDWDLPPSPYRNFCEYDLENQFGYVYLTEEGEAPFVGMKLISEQGKNFYAVDNDGVTDDNLGVYSGFDHAKKWKMVSGGIGRVKTNYTDVSAVISAGPMRMRANDTMRVVFALFAAETLDELINTANNSENIAKGLFDVRGEFSSNPSKSGITLMFPNPLENDELSIFYMSDKTQKADLNIYDITGKKVKSIFEGKELETAHYTETVNLASLAESTYMVVLHIGGKATTEKLTIIR